MKEEGGEEPRRSWRDAWCRIQSKYIARYSQRIENTVLKCLILLLLIIVFILIRGEKCGNKQMFFRVWTNQKNVHIHTKECHEALDRKGILHPGQQDAKGNEQAVCDLSYMATLKTSDSWKQGRVVAIRVGDWQTGVWRQRVQTLHQNRFCRGC